MTYYKIIGNNYGNYPYRIGLNTLKHNNETFNPKPQCCSGGLYFCDICNISDYMFECGDNLCIISLPDDAQIVRVDDKFKADKIIIEKIISLREKSTWEYLAEQGINKHRALMAVIGEDLLDVVRFLIELGVDVTVESSFALQHAAGIGRLEVVKLLVANGADVHARGDYALVWAAREGHLDVVKFLVENGADFRVNNNIALGQAKLYNRTEVVNYLNTF